MRMKLFDTVVTPTAIYGLSTAPLSAADVEHLAAVQRKMLRLMVGFVKDEGDTWEDMYRRLMTRLEIAFARRPIRLWDGECRSRKLALQTRLGNQVAGLFLQYLHAWNPNSVVDPKLSIQLKRPRGRPRASWQRGILYIWYPHI